MPSFATGMTVSLDGAEVPHDNRDGYVAIDRVPAGALVTLDYAQPERHADQVVRVPQAAEGGTGAYFGPKADPIVGHRIPTKWRGNCYGQRLRIVAAAASRRRAPGLPLVLVDKSTHDRPFHTNAGAARHGSNTDIVQTLTPIVVLSTNSVIRYYRRR